jgi:hypothetical protein
VSRPSLTAEDIRRFRSEQERQKINAAAEGVLQQPLRYMDGSEGEGTMWYTLGAMKDFSGPVTSPIAAEAHKGPVIDGTARRLG